MTKKRRMVVTPEQYRIFQTPVVPPTPQDLFDFQIDILVARGLMKRKDADPFRENLPSGLFLLIPPRPKELDLNRLMSLVVVDGVSGTSYLDSQHLGDEVEVPSSVYLMEGVGDGASRLNVNPSVNLVNILKEGRSPPTTFEGIILTIVFPEVLKHHFLDLIGSRYKSVYHPSLYFSGVRPGLDAYWHVDPPPVWGAPSCLRRRT